MKGDASRSDYSDAVYLESIVVLFQFQIGGSSGGKNWREGGKTSLSKGIVLTNIIVRSVGERFVRKYVGISIRKGSELRNLISFRRSKVEVSLLM